MFIDFDFSHFDLLSFVLRFSTYIALIFTTGSALLSVSLSALVSSNPKLTKSLNKQALYGAVLLTLVACFQIARMVFEWEMELGLLLRMTVGQALILRAFAGLVIIYCIYRQRKRLWILAAVVLPLSFGMEGHSQSLEDPNFPSLLLSFLVVVHVAIACWWLAVITPLISQADDQNAKLPDFAEAFGKQAMLAVPLLILAGTTLLVLFYLSETSASLQYLAFMALKLLFVACLLLLAAQHKFRSVPTLQTNSSEAYKRFAFSLKVEWAIAAGLLLVTALLVTIGLE